MKELIIRESGEKVYNFISQYITSGKNKTLVVSTTTSFNIDNQPDNHFETIINLKRINDIRRINKFFESVNAKLPLGGIYINNAETYFLRKKRILKKYPPVLNYIYYSFYFLFKRVFPKLPITKKIYFFITRGNNRILSQAETLGRLYSCGFELLSKKYINGKLFFITKKIKEPAFDYNPTYGIIVRLKRVGKEGKIINFYKFRTMHPYSEYIQKYIYDIYGTKDGDKAVNDYRVTTLGNFLRKYWIDELPMLINLLKGDLKIVGVRPLSSPKLKMYPKHLQKKRIKYKPGLVPPFYADLPKSFDEHMETEYKYLLEYEKHPFSTDVKYFFKATYNILFKKARSR